MHARVCLGEKCLDTAAFNGTAEYSKGQYLTLLPSQTIVFSTAGELYKFSIAAVKLREFGLLVPLQYQTYTEMQETTTILSAHITTPLSDEAVFFATPSWAVHVIEVTAMSSSRESIICTVPVSLAPPSRVKPELILDVAPVAPTPLSDVLVSRWFNLWQHQQLSVVDRHHQQGKNNPSSPNIATFKSNLRRIVDHHLQTHASAAPTYSLRLNRWAATSWEDFQARSRQLL